MTSPRASCTPFVHPHNPALAIFSQLPRSESMRPRPNPGMDTICKFEGVDLTTHTSESRNTRPQHLESLIADWRVDRQAHMRCALMAILISGLLSSLLTCRHSLRTSGLSRSRCKDTAALDRYFRHLGSPSCEVIWKPWVTPWGQSLSKPRARVRSTSEIAVGLWPTTTTPSGGQTIPAGTSLSGMTPDGKKKQVTLQNVVLSLWSTLRTSDGEKGGPNMSFGARGFTASVASFCGKQYVECSDGKWRALPPPRVRWLGNGIPGRVDKLRGLGNAIDPRPAAEMIRAYMDAA